MMSIGSTTAWTQPHLIPCDDSDTDNSLDGDEAPEDLIKETDEDVEALRDYLAGMDAPLQGDIDLDAFMASASHAKMKCNVQAKHLSKFGKLIWIQHQKSLTLLPRMSTGNKRLIYQETMPQTTRC